MLTPEDASVVARDPGLPALRVFLDDDAALQVFKQHYPEIKPHSATCTYLRYKPGTSCLASYTIATATGDRSFYAKAYPRGKSEKISKVLERTSDQDESQTGVFTVSDLSAVFTAFPYDHELPALQMLEASAGSIPLLTRLAPKKQDIQNASVVPLRYKPERRFVARLDFDGKAAAVLKVHTKARYLQAKRAMKSLGLLANFTTAKALGHSDRYCTQLLAWLEGSSLKSQIDRGRIKAESFAAAGACLAQLHRQSIEKLPRRLLEQECNEVNQQANDFKYMSDTLQARLLRLTIWCADALAGFAGHAVPTHGDFHPGQLLVGDGSASLIDLDNVALGNPTYDLGSFLAQLEYAYLSGAISEIDKEVSSRAFLEGYQSVASVPLHSHAVNTYTAASLVRLIHEPFRHRAADWRDRQEAILQSAEELIADHDSQSSHRNTAALSSANCATLEKVEVFDDPLAGQDEELPWLSQAIDPDLASEVIGPWARQAFECDRLELKTIRVLRHKPGRRCLIAYEFGEGSQGERRILLGKVHAKNRHDQSFQLQKALWNDGFDDQSDDGVSVAKPVAIVPQWKMWLQQHVPGVNGWEVLKQPASSSTLKLLAEAARKLHQSNLIVQRTHTTDDEVAILEERLHHVMSAKPRLAERVEKVLEGCKALATTVDPSTAATIHRDFYPDQVIFHRDRIYLLDLDLFCHGNPSLDIGNYLAHLLEMGIRRPKERKLLDTATRQFMQTYAQCDQTVSQAEIEVFTTLSLARQISISTQFKDRAFATERILRSCEQRLALLASKVSDLRA